MKKSIAIIAILLLIAGAAYARMTVIGVAGMVAAPVSSCADSSCAGFLVCQNFEGTGYDNSEAPYESLASGGTIDEDDTTATVLRGSQQLYVIGASSASSYILLPDYDGFSAQSELWVHFRVKFTDVTPTASHAVFVIQNASDQSLAQLDLRTDGNIRYYNGGNYATTSGGGIFTDNTKKHIWVHWIAGTGESDGETHLYYSDTATRPASPNHSLTNGSSATNATKIRFGEYGGVTGGVYVDQILARASEIGDVCD